MIQRACIIRPKTEPGPLTRLLLNPGVIMALVIIVGVGMLLLIGGQP